MTIINTNCCFMIILLQVVKTMNYFVDELKEKKIINKEDIETLKNYINKKYIEITSEKRADMLSKTIHNILDTSLEGLPQEYKKNIKLNTLKNTFLKNKSSIFMYDLFNSCIEEKNLKSDFKNELLKWVNSHVQNRIAEDDLDCYINGISDSSNTPTEVVDIAAATERLSSQAVGVNNIDYKISDEEIPTGYEHENNLFTIKSKDYTFTFKTFLSSLKSMKRNKQLFIAITIISIFAIQIVGQTFCHKNIFKNALSYIHISQKDNGALEELIEGNDSEDYKTKFPNTHLPEYMRYKKIDEDKLKAFLNKRDSLLSKDPYFSTLLSTAKEFNLNPIVLFAITGQEQSFVPRKGKNAYKIANNPFNVYHSWQEYNTDIKDSSRIAARTVINLAKGRPKDKDPFLWIGKEYAEDKNWGSGVRAVFKEINNYIN